MRLVPTTTLLAACLALSACNVQALSAVPPAFYYPPHPYVAPAPTNTTCYHTGLDGSVLQCTTW